MKKVLRNNFFSREPLNYETLTKRCAQISTQHRLSSILLQDYIKANRKIQKYSNLYGKRFNSVELKKHSNLLGIDLNVSNSRLEQDLWHFLKSNWVEAVSDNSVVNAYILGSRASNIDLEFQIVVSHYFRCMNATLSRNGSLTSSSVQAFARVLLKRNDYQNCFKLINETYGSPRLIEAKRSRFMRILITYFGGSLSISALCTLTFSLLDVSSMLPLFCTQLSVLLLSGGFSIIALGLAKLHELNRVSWRPYVSFFHRYLYQELGSTMDQIVTYFEEHNEVNLKNYHLRQESEGALQSSSDDYEVLAPNNHLREMVGNFQSNLISTNNNLLRSEVAKRKLLWNGLKEEQVFLEFWMSHGEIFEWVEPDQDPADMYQRILLKKKLLNGAYK